MNQQIKRTYLDYNATAPVRPAVKNAIMARLGEPLNPSSVHKEGRTGRRLIEEARLKVATLVRADPKTVTFTSGGTEANNTALSPLVLSGSSKRTFSTLFVSAVEHPCILAGGRFGQDKTELIPCDATGVVDLERMRERLEKTGPAFVSVMLANNETGAIQPVRAVADLVHSYGGFLHVDAVQAAGKISVDIHALQADSMSVSAHKIGGPQGVGALIKRESSTAFPPLLTGGGQELGSRAGTENVLAIESFGIAAEEALAEQGGLEDYQTPLENQLRQLCTEVTIFAETAKRLPNTTCFALPDKRAETALIAYDMANISVSSGSACSSGKVGASHVLAAMGVAETEAAGAIRISTGWATTHADIDAFIEATKKIL